METGCYADYSTFVEDLAVYCKDMRISNKSNNNEIEQILRELGVILCDTQGRPTTVATGFADISQVRIEGLSE